MMSSTLADYIQVWGFENGFTIFSDGSFGFGFKLSPIDVSCWDDDHLDSFAVRICSVLNGFPSGIDLQFIQDIGVGNETIISVNEKLLCTPSDPTRESLHQSRIEYLRKLEIKGAIPKYSLKLFVRRSPLTSLLRKPKLFSKIREFQDIAETQLSRELNITAQLREDIIRSLGSLGIRVTQISERSIAKSIYDQWNPTRAVPLNNYDPDDIRSSLVFTDASIYDRGFSLGNMHYRVLSLKLLPDQTYSTMARLLCSLPFDSRLFLSVRVPDQQKELESLQSQRRLAYSMARGKKSGVSDIESEAKFQDLEELISQLVAQGEKVFHLSLNVLLRAENEAALIDQVSQTLLTIREMGGAEAMEETLASFDLFSDFSLPNARSTERSKRIKTSNASDFLPVYGPWKGHEIPRILLKSLQGSLVALDPFSKDLSNYNQIVTGGSGSGKSFLTNILLLQMLKENPRVFIVDIGGSYKKLCENLSGQYIPFDLNAELALNPFDLLPGETHPTPQKIKFLVGLIEMMTKEDDENRIGRLERAEIEEAIQETYKAPGLKSLSSLKAILLEHKDEAIRRFGKILAPWCGNTPFGRMVDRKTTIELQRPIVSFDLKGLETYPDLQAVCLYIITDFVWREVQKDRSSMKFLVFDECWKLLESEAGASFIGEVFRTFRKYYASAIAISQNIDDFAKSKVANAVLPNTSLKWVLMQKGADQARLREVLQLNENEMALIAALHQERGVYSQAFLMAEDKHCVVAIEPTPLEYWIATTDPRDLALIDERIKSNSSIDQLDLLKQLSTEFPKGIVTSKEDQ